MKVFASVLIATVCLSGKIFNNIYFNFKVPKSSLKHLLYDEVDKSPHKY